MRPEGGNRRLVLGEKSGRGCSRERILVALPFVPFHPGCRWAIFSALTLATALTVTRAALLRVSVGWGQRGVTPRPWFPCQRGSLLSKWGWERGVAFIPAHESAACERVLTGASSQLSH